MTSRHLLPLGAALALLVVFVLLSSERVGMAVAAPAPGAGLAAEGPELPDPEAYADGVPGLAPEPDGRQGISALARAKVEQAPAGPRGRVLTMAGAGIPTVDADLWLDGVRLAGATSSRDGRFRLPAPEKGEASVRLRPDPRWIFVPHELPLDPASARGESELVFHAKPAERAPFHGVLVDARTGEPIPHFHFMCWDPVGTDNHLTTDASGRFSTEQGYGVGRIRLALSDFEGSYARYGRYDHERLEPDEDSSIPVRVGPTYRLAFTPPEGYVVSQFFAEVRGHRRTARHYPDFFMRSRLRDGDEPWVRLHTDELTEGPGPPWHLTLVSDDGLWSGSVPVDSLTGIQPQVLPLQVSLGGTLRGRVQDESGTPLSANLHLLSTLTGWEDWTWSDREGGLDYGGLEPGEYELSIATDRHEPWSTVVHIERGEVTLMRADLVPRAVAGAIEGTVSTESGTPRSLLVEARHSQDGSLRYAGVEWTENDGRWQGQFQLPALPQGFWELRITAEELGLASEPDTRALRAPARGVTFHLLDDVPTTTWSMEVVGADGAPIEGAQATLEAAAGRALFAGPVGSGLLLGTFPLTTDLHWLAWAPGHGVVQGDQRAFADRGEGRVARVTLAPGWGARLTLMTEDGLPVPGVSVLLDGEPTVPSDGRGRLLVARPTAPGRLEVSAPDWALAERNWTVDPEAGHFAAGDGGEIGIYLAPAR